MGAHEDANRAVVRRYYREVWETGRVEALDELLAAEYRDHDPLPGFGGDRRDAAAMVEAALSSLPARHLDVQHVVVEGDLAAAHWSLSWRSAEGVAGRMRGHDFFRVQDGRITVELCIPGGERRSRCDSSTTGR